VKLFADYRQIHVCAVGAKGDLAKAWTAKATDDRIAAAGDIIGIGTEVADDIDVTVAILDTAPAAPVGEHVTEASLAVRTGVVAVIGCTDYLPDARRFKVASGTWRMRATHTNLAKSERIKIELWPAKSARPRVLVRYSPPKGGTKPVPKGAPRNRKQAIEAALHGKVEVALEVLLDLHSAGDAAASAAAAEILAFQGRWDEAVPCAKALLARPDAVHTANVLDDMRALLARRAKLPKPGKRATPQRAHYKAAIETAQTGKRFKGKPKELAQHCFSLAVVFNVDSEIIKRWDPKHPYMHFDQAAEVARALVRAKQPKRAWDVLASRLSRWYPVDSTQVLPVVLLTDPLLAPLMTPSRAQLVMRTPRAVQ
jgi:hypothetical protein